MGVSFLEALILDALHERPLPVSEPACEIRITDLETLAAEIYRLLLSTPNAGIEKVFANEISVTESGRRIRRPAVTRLDQRIHAYGRWLVYEDEP
jgi:hypothetical protein